MAYPNEDGFYWVKYRDIHLMDPLSSYDIVHVKDGELHFIDKDSTVSKVISMTELANNIQFLGKLTKVEKRHLN